MELDQVAKLKRYFFLGKLIPVYAPRKADSLIEDFDVVKELLATVDAECFLTIVKNLTQREEDQLPRRNEVWFAYAVYMSACDRVDDRKKAYQAFPVVARTAEDMFTVVHYARLIQKKKGSKGHSRTTRKALTLWYESKSEAELIQMLEKNRGMYGLSHKDLIASSHINMEKTGLTNLQDVLFESSGKALETVDVANASKWKSPGNHDKLKAILELKTSKDGAKAGKIIEKHNVGLECVPTNLLCKFEVWQALIPQMKYRQLLNSMFPLIDSKLIGHGELNTELIKSIGNVSALTEANVSPVFMLIHAKKLQVKKRYSEKKKALSYAEKVKRNNIKDNALVACKVMSMFKESFDHVKPKTGLKICFVLNLQASYATKAVINQTQVNCTEAALTMALMYFRSESNVDVFTFTPSPGNLEQLNWAGSIPFDVAEKTCKGRQTPKNAQRLITPVAFANKKVADYDVFLIVVPSAARRNPSNKPDALIQSLVTYRKTTKNERARIIIVNLRRYTPSMIHDQTKQLDNGILEICGFGENIIKVINAYATHAFS